MPNGKRFVLLLVAVIAAVQFLVFGRYFGTYDITDLTYSSQKKLHTSNDIDNDGYDENETNLILFTYQNPEILNKSCSITVTLMEPNINEYTHWMLESVVDNLYPKETTCFLLQTSTCRMKQKSIINETDDTISNQNAFKAMAESIIENSQPKFRVAIEKGNVRMSVIDHTKYNLKACDDFRSANNAWLHVDYWGEDEFVELDSDMILMIQTDGVMCHPMNVNQWNEFAFVGAPWPPKRGNSFFQMCSAMPRSWRRFIFEEFKHNLTFPPYPTEDDICENYVFGAQGNGGMSIRSRSWMEKAIRYCPTLQSGLSMEEIQSPPCSAETNKGQEDMYFATILRGMGAPLPNVYEASLFGSEMRMPDDFEIHYNLTNITALEEMAQKRWYSPDNEDNGGLERYRRMKDSVKSGTSPFIISIIMHKIWAYRDQEFLSADYLREECPYLEHVNPKSKV